MFQLKDFFVNTDERRPRAGWRLLLQFALFLAFATLLFLLKSMISSVDGKILNTVILCTAGTATVWIAAAVMDKRAFADYGLAIDSTWRKEMLIGWGIGTASISVIFLIEWSSGMLAITGFGWNHSSVSPYILTFSGYFISMVMVGFYEELIFRGYQVLNLMEGLQSSNVRLWKAGMGALAVTAVIFGLMHAGNPNATGISTVNIIFAGIALAVPYLVTGRLALSIGIHISWNFMQGGIYGFPVSGMPFRGSLLSIDQNGSELLTGGAFGPEAGLLGIAGVMLILMLVYLYVSKAGYTRLVHLNFDRTHHISDQTDEQG